MRAIDKTAYIKIYAESDDALLLYGSDTRKEDTRQRMSKDGD